MASQILQSASEISTHFRCHNCGILLHKVIWKQCEKCKAFDLCNECANIPYDRLFRETRADHQKLHENNEPITGDSLQWVKIYEVEETERTVREQRREQKCQRIFNKKEIANDYDMAVVMDKFFHDPSPMDNQVNSMVVNYYLKANQRNIRVLSLDGGGIRGYMPIKIIGELIARENGFHIEDLDLTNTDDKTFFLDKQKELAKQFDYFVGTSTGGLIAFCLAVNYNILDMKEIYSDSRRFFKRNRLGPLIFSKYDPSVIHNKIDEIIDHLTFPGKTFVSRPSEHATLLDLRNLLNPENVIGEDEIEAATIKHGNLLEFVDEKNLEDIADIDDESSFRRVPREKVLLITSYNTTANIITIFNTSYSKHWGYRIADVLKATMAAPTYFPPQKIYYGTQMGGRFTPVGDPELFVDGGIFANDPEVAALWAIRMQWKKAAKYLLLCVGTGCYTSTLSPSTWGGYFGWIFNQGFLINTLMDATRSFTEIIAGNLAKFNDMRRMKLNYQITIPMALDDSDFVNVFDREWETYLKDGDDFKAFIYFYENYIAKKVK